MNPMHDLLTKSRATERHRDPRIDQRQHIRCHLILVITQQQHRNRVRTQTDSSRAQPADMPRQCLMIQQINGYARSLDPIRFVRHQNKGGIQGAG